MRTNTTRKFGLALSALVLVVALLAVFGAVPVSAQVTWYVDDDNCPGPGTGTVGDPFCKIQDAIDAAGAGDTINVAAGTYTETVTITPGADLTIQGAGRDVTTWIAPADDASRMHCIKCADANNTTLDISGFTFSVEDNAISTSGIAININSAKTGPLYLDIHDNKFVETTTIANETANSMLLCHNRFAARNAAPVKIYNNLDETTGGIAMSNTRAFDIYDNTFDGGSDALYIGYGCPENTTIGDHHIYNNTFKNASNAYPDGPWPSIFFSYYGSGTGMTFLPSTIENNDFEDNDMAIGYSMESNIAYPDDVIQFNNFDNNDEAMKVWGTHATTVDAENNWWGDASGPEHPSTSVDCKPPSEGGWNCDVCDGNPDGTGDKVSDNVDYCPWLGAGVEEAKSETITGTATITDTVTGGDVTITATDSPTVTVTTASYKSNPGGGHTFVAEGYFDVHLDTITDVTSVEIEFCPASASTVVYYWDGVDWPACGVQHYEGGCVVVTIPGPPGLDYLTGGPFATGHAPPEPVGGIIVPVNRLGLLAPWMGLLAPWMGLAAMASFAALTVALVKRRRA